MTARAFRQYQTAVTAHLIASNRNVRRGPSGLFAYADGLRHGLVMSHDADGPVLKYLRAAINNIVPNYVAEGWDALFKWEDATGVDVWRRLDLDCEDVL